MNDYNESPVVSIGMPVFNSEQSIREVLDSLLLQTFEDFELIISDNASTDSTTTICLEYANRDLRIKYIRQPKNIGAENNFRFVLEKSVGKYFMFAAGDDIRSSDYIEETYNQLENNERCAFASTPNCFFEEKNDSRKKISFDLRGDYYSRVSMFLRIAFKSQACFYSLVRTTLLKEVYRRTIFDYLGADWAIIIAILSYGEFHRTDKGMMHLGSNGISRTPGFIKSLRKERIEYVMPFYQFTKYFISEFIKNRNISYSKKILLGLRIFKFNIDFAVNSRFYSQ